MNLNCFKLSLSTLIITTLWWLRDLVNNQASCHGGGKKLPVAFITKENCLRFRKTGPGASWHNASYSRLSWLMLCFLGPRLCKLNRPEGRSKLLEGSGGTVRFYFANKVGSVIFSFCLLPAANVKLCNWQLVTSRHLRSWLLSLCLKLAVFYH